MKYICIVIAVIMFSCQSTEEYCKLHADDFCDGEPPGALYIECVKEFKKGLPKKCQKYYESKGWFK